MEFVTNQNIFGPSSSLFSTRKSFKIIYINPSVAKPARHLVMQMQVWIIIILFFTNWFLIRSMLMHLHDQMSGWLRHWIPFIRKSNR